MKKKILLLSLLSILAIQATTSCGQSGSSVDYSAINTEIRRTYNYFMDTTNLNDEADGYGLVQDRFTNRAMASMAATGFALAACPIYVEEGLMPKKDAEKLALGTINTCIKMQADPTTSYGGCLAHFVNKSTAKRMPNSEISTIDTGLLISGAIVAGEYFQGEVKQKAEELWGNVDYNKFLVTVGGKQHMSMGVKDPSHPTQISVWNGYAEHLCMYLIGAGNPNKEHRIPGQIYLNMKKPTKDYNMHTVIHSWFGSLFTYQFSHSFFNFNEYVDDDGVNWFDNSVEASLAAYEYCQDYKEYYKTYSEKSWGLTACDTPLGYSGLLGCEPRGFTPNDNYYKIAGTVSPCAAIGSMPFTPTESLRALKHFQTIPVLSDETFGLRDAYNLDFNGNEWIDPDFIGIDKGISILQMYNYKNKDFISNLGNHNKYIQEAFEINHFTKVDK